MSVLEVHDVSIRYMMGDFKDIGLKEYVMRRLTGNYHVIEFWADHHITFSLEKGDMLGIIGTNGAGKSTLLKAISGIMEPTGGYVKREGSIAALLELASGFDGDLTVRENTYLRGAMLGYTRKFMDEKYPQIIEFAELEDFQDRPFKQLSSGMMSRLAFSVASLVHPDILILDEVLSVGDGAFRRKSEAKMREIIDSGATTILVSHSVEQVREMSNKVLWIEKGNQIGFGDTDLLCDLYQGYLDGRISLDEAKARLTAAGARSELEKIECSQEAEASSSEQKQGLSSELMPEVSVPTSEGKAKASIYPMVHDKNAAFMENKEDAVLDRPLFDSVQSWLESHFARHHRIIFLSSFVLILLTHLYLFTNLFINHDNVHGMFYNCDCGLASGRWLLQLVTNLAGNFSSSWLDGIVSALFLAAVCMIFAAIFDIRRPLPVGLLVLCMVAFPTVTSIYTYMFNSSQDFLSMLLAVLAVWLIRRGGIGTSLLGVLCITCSMGIYQAFFCLTAATLVLTMLIEVCRGRWKDSFTGFLITGLRYLGWLVLGLVLYLVVTKVCLWYTGTELVDYQGISSMGQITLPILLQRVKDAYQRLITYYFYNPMYPKLFSVLVAVSVLVDAVVVGLLLAARQLHKSASNLLQLAMLLVVFPLACNSIYLMVESWTVHNLMVYPAILPLLLPVILGNQITARDLSELGKLGKGRLRTLAALCVCGLLIIQAAFGYQFFVLTNRAYTCMDLTYESAYAYLTRLTAKIELQEGFTPDSHIALLGNASLPSTVPDVYMTGVLSLESAINMYSRYQFLYYFMSSPYHYASQEEEDMVKASQEFQQMPCYPAEGSVITIDGVIVVKLGEQLS